LRDGGIGAQLGQLGRIGADADQGAEEGSAAPGSPLPAAVQPAQLSHSPADEDLRARVARLEREIAELRAAIGDPVAEGAR